MHRPPFSEAAPPEQPPIIGSNAVLLAEPGMSLMRTHDQMVAEGVLGPAQVVKGLAEEKFGPANAELFSIQEKLRQLQPYDRGILEGYLAHYFPEDPQLRHYGDRVSMLSTDSLQSKRQLVQFLAYHEADVISQRQNPAFEQAVGKRKQRFAEAVEWGVDNQWLSPSMILGAEAVQATQVYVGDLWDTTLKGRLGYHTTNTSRIIVAPDHDKVTPGAEIAAKTIHTIDHEFEHVALDSNRRGGLLPRWLQEARAEHFALAADSNTDESYAVIDPEERREAGLLDLGKYEKERELLALLCTGGLEVIDLKQAMRALSRNSTDSYEWLKFEQALNDAWGDDALYNVNQRVDTFEKQAWKADEIAAQKAAQARLPYTPLTKYQVQYQALKKTIAYYRPKHIGAAVLTGAAKQ